MLKLLRTSILSKNSSSVKHCLERNVTRRRCLSTETPTLTQETPSIGIPAAVVGQPTCFTHPHLVPTGHLTCDVTQTEYRDRRTALVARLSAENPNAHRSHIIVIPGAVKQYMSDKIPYVFRQHTDFYYLTGCLEAGATLVLVKPNSTDNYKSILFVHDKDSHAELWEGPRTGCSLAKQLFTMDEARPVATLHHFLQKIVSQSKPSILWYCNGSPANPDVHTTINSILRSDSSSVTLSDPQKTIHAMRIIKSPAEMKLMRDTCYIGSQSINLAMSCTKPGVSEHTLNAILDYSCRSAGAEHLAFPPVVAGGARATHIHYVANNQILTENDMVLVDTGCQRWLYNSDISRTWPVSGKFSRHHLVLYEIVLTVQKRLIEILGQHRPSLDVLFDSMCRLLGTHLQQEGIIRKDVEGQELINRAYNLCPHHVSHYLGMDVHDTALMKRNMPVETGMVVTVEPGIYVSPDDLSVPAEFRGVGIRIEDDVLITDGAPLVLTDAAVKEVGDIEALVGKQAL